MKEFNINLSQDKVRFIIDNLKQIENTNKNKDMQNEARYIQDRILWEISRQCGHCKDDIEDSICLHRDNKCLSYYNCRIEDCPLLK